MKAILTLIESLGFNLSLLIAGSLGSLIGLKKGKPFWHNFLTVIVSALIANYVTPVVISLFGLEPNTVAGIGFIVGYSNKAMLEYVLERLKKK
jgi:energy-converting hydrogenase Eha subunit A